MIRIDENWIIDVDDYQYTLKRDLHRTRIDHGKVRPEYKTQGHYSTLSKALNALHKEMVRDELRDGEAELSEAVRIINECTSKWEQLTKEIIASEV